MVDLRVCRLEGHGQDLSAATWCDMDCGEV